MRHYARPLRATLTTLLRLVAMAGAAGAEGAAKLIGDFPSAGCPLDDCPGPPSSRGLGSPAGVPESADKAETLRALEHAAVRAEEVLGDLLFQDQHVPRQAARGLMWLTLGRDWAGTHDNWIKPLYENAFRRANDDEQDISFSVHWFVSPLISWPPLVAYVIGVCIFLWRQIPTPRAPRASCRR
jgi:hypothetical protein